MPPRLSRARAVRIGLTIAALAVVGVIGVGWWARRLAPARVDAAVRTWAAARVLALSDSIYRLSVGSISYNPAVGSVSLDSFRLTTDSARNAARSRPLPIVTLLVRGGHVGGIRLRNVVGAGRRAIAIGTVQIDDVDAEVVLPPPLEPTGGSEATGPAIPKAAATPSAPTARPAQDTSGAKSVRSAADSARELGFFEWRRGVSLPKGVPRIRIGQVLVPQVTIVVRPTTGAQGQLRVLPQLAMELDSLVMDARDTATTPIYARDIRLRAERYHGGWDSLTSLSIERAEGSFADSVLRVDGVEIRPTKSDAEMRRAGGPRHTRVIATLGRFDGRGIAWGEILKHATLVVRAAEIEAPRLDLLSDQNLPEARGGDAPRMPNQVMRDFPLRVLIDSVRVRNGKITYGELEPGQPMPGVVTFEGIEASILNLSNDPGRMSVEQPALLTASARIMGTGLLSAVLEIPLLSERFDMKYHGTLGPMPFTDFNRFAAPNSDVHFSHGDVLGVEFDATVTAGRAKGRVVPRYRNLAIGLDGKDEGIVAKAKRSIRSFIANRFVLRQNNPERDAKGSLVTAVIDRRRRPSEGLFTFLWFTLRDPIRKVVKP
jgi:hypothetical protein